jgi:hypothetical protein
MALQFDVDHGSTCGQVNAQFCLAHGLTMPPATIPRNLLAMGSSVSYFELNRGDFKCRPRYNESFQPG